MFDRLMLMAMGKIIYFNEARLSVDYFSAIGYKCPELSNPADYFMSIMSIESLEQDDEEQKEPLTQADIQNNYIEKIKHFDSSYQNSNLRNDFNYNSPHVSKITDADINNQQVGWCI
jgi:ABC-type multidrug transport system ATPase subunit